MTAGEGWLWLLTSFLIGTASAQAYGWLRLNGDRRAWVRRVLEWPFLPPLLTTVRALFYLGVPAAALLWGRDAVIGRLLGFQPFLPLEALLGTATPPDALALNLADWARDVAWATGMGTAAWAALAIGKRAVRHAGTDGPSAARDGLRHLQEALFHEVHWAFYRNAPVVELGTYWGTWAGLALVAAEALLNPQWRAALRDADRSWEALTRSSLIFLSAVVYLQTQNLWLAILVHWGVTWGAARVR